MLAPENSGSSEYAKSLCPSLQHQSIGSLIFKFRRIPSRMELLHCSSHSISGPQYTPLTSVGVCTKVKQLYLADGPLGWESQLTDLKLVRLLRLAACSTLVVFKPPGAEENPSHPFSFKHLCPW